jgi:thioredoxin-like negative regulator of GroEL
MLSGKNLIPTYEQVATNLKGIALVAKIDATVEEGLAHRYGIRGFPTLKLFKPGAKNNDLQDYQGQRSASALVSFVTSALSSSGIVRVKSSNADSLWSSKPVDVPRVILFSTKPEPSTLYKSLSMRYQGQLVLSMVQQNDPLTESYKIDKFPSILVLTSQEAEPVKFEGEKLSPEAVVEFLAQFAASSQSDSKSSSSSASSTESSSNKPSRPVPAAATWKEASNWDSALDSCGKAWCILLLNREPASVDEVKSRMITLYGKEGKFQFVEVKEDDGNNTVGSKFSVQDESQWVVFNVKKSKFAKTAFDGNVPTALLDRVVSGDAKMSLIQ